MDGTGEPRDAAGLGFAHDDGGAGPRLPEWMAARLWHVLQGLLGPDEVGLPEGGPGGDPVAPPGLPPPGGLIPEWEIKRIRDALLKEVVGRIFLPEAGIAISGVELTQAIQFFNFDNLSSGAGADNSVPLVAGKDLLVRVFVASTFGIGSAPDTVTGRVVVGGQTLTPLNGPLQPRPSSQLRRSQLDHSLNFRVPRALCHGNRTLRISVFDARPPNPFVVDHYGPKPKLARASRNMVASFRDMPPIRLRGYLVNYTGNGQNLAAPTGTAFIDTVMRFLPMFPTHGYDFGPCEVVAWAGDMSIASGGKDSGWDSLINNLLTTRSASTVRAVCIGLLPANLAGTLGTSQRGIGNWGVAVAAQDDTRALSHEIGHAFGIRHLDDGIAAGPYDSAYPTYGTFPFASIGEFGVNVQRMTLFDPNTARDFMSYFDANDVPFPVNSWISPYFYRDMMDTVSINDGNGDIVLELVIIVKVTSFRIHRDGHVEILPSYTVEAPLPRERRPRSDVMIDMRDADGTVLRSHRCHAPNPYQDPDGPWLDYHEVLPWSDDIRALAFLRHGHEMDVHEVDRHRLRVRLAQLHRAEAREGNDLARVEWTVDDAEVGSHAMVRYSNDDGRTWTALSSGIVDGRYLARLHDLPGGERCRFEVIVSNGLASTSERTEAFAVPVKARRAHLTSPHDGETFKQGAPVHFVGGGHSPDFGLCDDDDVVWTSSLQGVLGTGHQLVRDDLRPGRHRITVSVPDGTRSEVSADVTVRIVARGGKEGEDEGC